MFKRRQKGSKTPAVDSKPTKHKYVRPYDKTPIQAKQAYIMPTLLVAGVLMIGSGLTISTHNTHAYNQQVMASSMTTNTPLISWGRETQAKLTVGSIKLSKDGKTLAVEIKYDDTAHTVLSSFGKNYALRLVTPKDNLMTGTKMSYGLFGTDGSGVLTVHNPHGFVNKAFVVMLVDKGRLVTSDDLTTNATYSESDIDDSITAQLSGSASDSSDVAGATSTSNTTNVNKPAIYYVRLNGATVKRTDADWHNDRDIVNDLFVDATLKKRQQDMSQLQKKMNQANKTLDEMNERLKKNPDDTIAQNNQTSLNSTIESFKTQYDSAKKAYDKVKNGKITSDILEPKVNTYERFVANLDALNNNNSNN